MHSSPCWACNETGMFICAACNGSGLCQICEGIGYILVLEAMEITVKETQMTCFACQGSGICIGCEGKPLTTCVTCSESETSRR